MLKTNWFNVIVCISLLAIISFVFMQSNTIAQSQHTATDTLFKFQYALFDLDVAVEEVLEKHKGSLEKIEQKKDVVLKILPVLDTVAKVVSYNELVLPAMLSGRQAELTKLQKDIEITTNVLRDATLATLKDEDVSNKLSLNEKLEGLLLPHMEEMGVMSSLSELSAHYNHLDALLSQEARRYTIILYASFVALLLYMLGYLVYLRSAANKLEKQVIARSIALETQNVELLDARESALQAVRLKSEFLATMSHEIRTPMNGILGMTQMLKDTSMTAKQEQYVGTLVNSSEALLELINDILDFSKIESGKMELETAEFNLDEMAEEVVEMLSGRARERELEVFLRYVPDTPVMVIGDRVRIRQILTNLVGNAIKFTESGYVKVTIGVDTQKHPNIAPDETCLHVIVEDTGIGIPQDKLHYIFDKFSQADSSTTRKFGGTGLGLAICRELTSMMRGSIWVESELGKGSEFHFTMAVKNVSESNQVRLPDVDVTELLRGRKVLVVDDVPEYAMMLSEALSLQGIKAYSAYSGREALQLLHQACLHDEPFDMAILDYMMPEMDGIELANAIVQHENSMIAKLPLVMLTAVVGKLYTTRFREAGFAAYLVKPYRLRHIMKTLADVLQAQQQGSVMPIMSKSRTKEMEDNYKHFVGVRVLLVEDNKVNQEVALRLLDKLGCMVVVANNGLEAVNVLAKEAFDMVFMDCQMPEMDGYEATHVIRTQKLTNAPIVALTANAMRGDREKCLEAGMDDYVAKPVHFEDIQKVLHKWLDKNGEEVVSEATVQTHDDMMSREMVQHIPVLCPKAWQTLQDMVGSSFAMIIDHYKTGSESSFASIVSAYEAKDFDVVMRSAHSLKSSSAQVGAMTVSALAKEIENITRQSTNLDDSLLIDLISRLEKAQQDSLAAIELSLAGSSA